MQPLHHAPAGPAPGYATDEQLPVPCSRCGAPMREDAASDAPRAVLMRCGYCGAVEALPAELGARVARLRARLDALERTRADLEGLDLIVARQLETHNAAWLRGTLTAALGPLGLILVLVVGPAVHRSATQGYDGDARALFWTIALPLQMVFIVAGMTAGYGYLSRRYRARVRPWLLARAPLEPGLPTRCRCCGGALPPARTPFVPCVYCRAHNLVTEEVARDRERLLAREAEVYRARAAGAGALPLEHARLAARGVLLGNLAGQLVALGLSAALVALLAR